MPYHKRKYKKQDVSKVELFNPYLRPQRMHTGGCWEFQDTLFYYYSKRKHIDMTFTTFNLKIQGSEIGTHFN